ncbi:MAG TPA: TonB-dependent receptor [Xanthomonadaceae bacterium]
MSNLRRNRLTAAVHLTLLLALPTVAAAQETEQGQELDTISVTGSRIKQTNAVTAQPVMVLDRAKLEQSGAKSVAEILQQLPASGKALNAKFNSSGNFGYPPDGGGIGAGSAQVDLRNLGSQRVLVLVDGVRWVNESSASGVSGSADLNTIPLAIVERIEVLEDGASAIYGSDAIAGVVNIITRKNFEGAEFHSYYGEYSRGGETKDFSLTFGTGGDIWTGVFGATWYEQDEISSGSWAQSSECQPGAGLGACSSGTPQGRYVFNDPTNTTSYNITLNNGTTVPVFVPGNPNGGTYHQFTGADRFNFAPFNLMLTPSERKSLFANINIELTENTRLHFKGLFNNRQSRNQAAPEPIFVGPGAGTGGIADTISIPANHPFNPFGFALDANNNFVFIGRRPLEVGPRIFTQNVDTWYFNVGLDGLFNIGERSYGWDVNYIHSSNSATQQFTNGYNVAKIKLALGDPAACAATPGCTPLDLFGGQARPFTGQMIDWIRTNQRDASTQILDIFSFNVSGDLFSIGDRSAGFAVGAEYREYQGDFNPDPLRQTGESQDSFAAPVSAEYNVKELYGEFNFPVLASLDLTAAARWSDYSTFGDAFTGKLGFRWQPIEDLVIRGTRSTGFRAPNLGELYGLTQFGATLTDPCGPTGAPVVDRTNGVSPGLEAACVAQGVPDNFEQANTQITTFTGGNPNLDPEESDSWTVGVVYSPGWGEDKSWSRKLDVELGYYSHKIDGAIQSRDIQTLLNSCIAAGGTDARLCAPFTRQTNGNLRPPNNFLQNFGTVETDGADLKISWLSPEWGFGSISASLQTVWINDYKAIDGDDVLSSRQVGVEVGDSAIPEWQSNLQLGWKKGNFDFTYGLRYIDAVTEDCTSATIATVPGCRNASLTNTLGATTYHDIQVGWKDAFWLEGLKLSVGANNVFGKEPPVCVTCSLNGYDAGTYDLPGSFWYVSADYRF